MGIKRLASTLGISIATVSRALNDHPEVSVQTRERVRAAAKAIAYSPNQSGRSLRKGRHNTVGLMLPPKGSPQHHNWDPFHTLAEGIQVRIATEDLMPGAIGGGSFRKGMINYSKGQTSKQVADDIQKSWDALERQ